MTSKDIEAKLEAARAARRRAEAEAAREEEEMLRALAAAQEEEERRAEAERRRAEERRLAEEAEERRAEAERQRVAAEQREEEQRSQGRKWAIVLDRRTGYDLTTVQHRPPKKTTSSSMKSPSKAAGLSKAGPSRKREGSNYYPLPDNCWVCRDVKSTCIRGM